MFDEIDLHIIEKLARDGRTSLTELSNGSEVSRVAIANRIDKLIDNQLLKVSALLNLEKLNYQTLLVELQVENKKSAEFKKIISSCPKVLNAFEVMGQFNYMLACTDKTSAELKKFIEVVLKRFTKDCRITLASNILPGFSHVKPSLNCNGCARCKR